MIVVCCFIGGPNNRSHDWSKQDVCYLWSYPSNGEYMSVVQFGVNVSSLILIFCNLPWQHL